MAELTYQIEVQFSDTLSRRMNALVERAERLNLEEPENMPKLPNLDIRPVFDGIHVVHVVQDTPEVQAWLDEVEAVIKEAEDNAEEIPRPAHD